MNKSSNSTQVCAFSPVKAEVASIDCKAVRRRSCDTDRRASLVEAAYWALAEHGVEGLRTRDIAARAGIHHATMHYYFPTKADLILAIVDRLREQFVATYPLSPVRSPVCEHLGGYILEFARQVENDPSRFRVITQIFQLAGRDPSINKVLRERSCNNDWCEMLQALLREGIARGEFRPEISCHAIAQLLITFCLGLPTLAIKHPEGVAVSTKQFLDLLLPALLIPNEEGPHE